MSTKTSCAIAFFLGAAAGSVVAWKLLETKYKKIAQEEIDSVKATFTDRLSDSDVFVTEDASDEDKQEYASVINTEGYTRYSDIANDEKGGAEPAKRDKPYVISPEEFIDHDDFETISLTYYTDGVLADDFDEPVDDIDDVVGEDSLATFGRYEDDTVFVLDEHRGIKYEILRDKRSYAEVAGFDPHQTKA